MVRTVRARTEGLAAVRGQPVGDARLGDRGGAPFGLVPERVRARPAPAGYPAEWAGRSWMIRALAGFRCEHCGRCFPLVDSAKRRLVCTISTATASNLWDWNLVPLCLVDHGLVEREVHVDREQLAMFGSSFPWLGPRLAARASAIEAGLWTPGGRRGPAAVAGGRARDPGE